MQPISQWITTRLSPEPRVDESRMYGRLFDGIIGSRPTHLQPTSTVMKQPPSALSGERPECASSRLTRTVNSSTSSKWFNAKDSITP